MSRRGERVDREIGELTRLPPDVVGRLARVVRGGVADLVVQHLPGVVASPAPRLLVTAATALTRLGPDLARALRPDLSAGRAGAARLPAVFVYVAANELLDRLDAGAGDAPTTPDPSPQLRAMHQGLRETMAAQPGPVLADAGRTVARTITADATGQAWAGWAMLAAAGAVDAHQDALPGADDPDGFAFQLGRSLLHATAITLVEPQAPAAPGR